jgi:hypothetical protein
MRLAVTLSRRSLIAGTALAVLAPSALSLAATTGTPTDVPLSGLTLTGVEFPAVTVAPTSQITVTVSTAGDAPQAIYVTARSSGVAPLQRAASGQWVAWDGSRDGMVNTGLPAGGGRFVVPINVADLANLKFPTVIFVGYRTADGIKFGIFNLLIKQ